MPAHKIFDLSDGDLKIAMDLLIERDRCYELADKHAAKMREHQKEMLRLRREARELSCQDIAEKLEANKDIIFSISKCKYRPDDLQRINPDFYEQYSD